ncbi:hypothetical protein Bca101_092925 [Brassica carinata]
MATNLHHHPDPITRSSISLKTGKKTELPANQSDPNLNRTHETLNLVSESLKRNIVSTVNLDCKLDLKAIALQALMLNTILRLSIVVA